MQDCVGLGGAISCRLHTPCSACWDGPVSLEFFLLCTTFWTCPSWRDKVRHIEPKKTQADAEATFRCERDWWTLECGLCVLCHMRGSETLCSSL